MVSYTTLTLTDSIVDSLTFIKCSCTEVQGEVGLCANDLAPLEELVRTELVGFQANPCQLGSVIKVSVL